MKKFFKKAMVIAGATLMALTGTACAPGSTTGPGCLDVYVHDAGYGVEWCTKMLEVFVQEDWVKNKYPDLNITFTDDSSDRAGYVKEALEAGRDGNDFDLLFGFNSDIPEDTSILEDLTADVYDLAVPGESVLYKNKMFPTFLDANRDATSKTQIKYNSTPWAGGATGIYYNEDLLTDEGFSVPRTTDELIGICDDYYTKYYGSNAPTKYAFVGTEGLPYWQYLLPQLWAQYEGVQGYKNFWEGKANGTVKNIEIFQQEGRLYAAKVFEDLLEYGKYMDPSSLSWNNVQAQNALYAGNALFMVNGDWLEKEMENEDISTTYDIKLMRTPVISALGTDLGITDEQLASIVDYVDGVTAVKPTGTGIDDDVIDIVREARNVMYSIGSNHISFIPTYADEKDIAKDFLRFMATDKAQEIFMQYTGSILPFNYDVENSTATEYTSLSESKKELIKYLQGDAIEYLPVEQSFPLFRLGGVRVFYSAVADNYQSGLAAQTRSFTAQELYDETIRLWDNQAWQTAVTLSGI